MRRRLVFLVGVASTALVAIFTEAACGSFASDPATTQNEAGSDATTAADTSTGDGGDTEPAFDCTKLNERLDAVFDDGTTGELAESNTGDAGTLKILDGVLVASVAPRAGARAYAQRMFAPLTTKLERLRLSFDLVSISGTDNASLVVPGCSVTLANGDGHNANIRLELKKGTLALDDSTRIDGVGDAGSVFIDSVNG